MEDNDEVEDNNEVEDNDKDDNNYKDISAQGLDRDQGFSQGHHLILSYIFYQEATIIRSL